MNKNKIRQFIKDWKGHGEEIRDTENFWIELLTALGIESPTKVIKREKPVYINGTQKSIDVYLEGRRLLVEQKSYGIDLDKKELQSDGTNLTPYEQGRRYAGYLSEDERVTKIITCNFSEFRIYDLKEKRPELHPTVIKLSELDKKAHIFDFILKDENAELPPDEEEISVKAGNYIKELYDMFLAQYGDDAPLKDLNILCVRLVFLFYCEDAGIFEKDLFLNYLKASDEAHIGTDLALLFDTLNTTDRKKFLPDSLKAFPYVNGGLFAKEIEIPYITKAILDKLIYTSQSFDWSKISPVIFGALFESTINPETRRSGGMHYTSVKNIHKVIDPLFLTDLRDELDEILSEKSPANKKTKLDNFQYKLSRLKFLDPACGSGNFLTETYLCLREMENRVIEEKMDMDSTQLTGQVMAGTVFNPIKVSIQQFYGIEINDFAVSVAMTALWIAEAQTMLKTMEIVHQNIEFLPLETLPNIHEGNALRMDWEAVIPKYELNYIMGNPPFYGAKNISKEQKTELFDIFGKKIKAGLLDYVAGWYKKASNYITNTSIRCAFVSTNSITQGEQVAILWNTLENEGVSINYAYRTFKWANEATNVAGVSCVIIGFSKIKENNKTIYVDNEANKVNNINGYLIDADNVYIDRRNTPLCDVPKCSKGNQPTDGGHLLIEAKDYDEFVKKEPNSKKWIKRIMGSDEFINNKPRYCLWLVNITPSELRGMPLVLDRVKKCQEARKGKNPKLANKPTVFRETRNPNRYIAIPVVSSESRKYIPIGFLDNTVIPKNQLVIIPGADIYEFGVITSNVHMAWTRAVCGRLESRYCYSKDVVYNNFPWPKPTEEQKEKIEKTAQGILDARALYPNSSFADLYDPDNDYLYPELTKAHIANDMAVMEAYGIKKGNPEFHDESACVAMLMKMYQKLTEKQNV